MVAVPAPAPATATATATVKQDSGRRGRRRRRSKSPAPTTGGGSQAAAGGGGGNVACLNGLRVIGASLVFFGHSLGRAGHLPSALGGFTLFNFFVKPAALLAHAGSLGIDLFDVLSGFLAYLSCERRLFAGRCRSGDEACWGAPLLRRGLAWSARRVARVLPTYWFCLGLDVLLSGDDVLDAGVRATRLRQLLLLPMALSPTHWSFPTARGLRTAWTLAHWACFSFVAPALAAVVRRVWATRGPRGALALAAGACAVRLACGVALLRRYEGGGFLPPLPWEQTRCLAYKLRCFGLSGFPLAFDALVVGMVVARAYLAHAPRPTPPPPRRINNSAGTRRGVGDGKASAAAVWAAVRVPAGKVACGVGLAVVGFWLFDAALSGLLPTHYQAVHRPFVVGGVGLALDALVRGCGGGAAGGGGGGVAAGARRTAGKPRGAVDGRADAAVLAAAPVGAAVRGVPARRHGHRGGARGARGVRVGPDVGHGCSVGCEMRTWEREWSEDEDFF